MSDEHSEKSDNPQPDRFAFSAFIDALPEAIVIVDDFGRIFGLNVKAARLFGYERDELIGVPVDTLLPERLRNRHVAHQEHYNRSPYVRPMGAGMNVVARHKDGHEIPVEIGLGPYQSPDGPQVICTIRDLTGSGAPGK